MPGIRLTTIYLAVFGMSLSCLYAVLQLANRAVDNRLSVFGLLAVFVVSFAIFKALHSLIRFRWLANFTGWIIGWPLVTLIEIKLQLFPQTAIGDPVWLLSVPQAFINTLTKFEPAYLIMISTAVLWWLGQRLAAKKLDFPATIAEFQFGLIILLIIYFIAFGIGVESGTALAVTLIFFTCGLIGISVAHDQVSRGWSSSLNQWHWPAMLALGVGLILLAGLIVSIIISPDFLQLILNFIAWLWHTFENFLRWLANLFPQSNEPIELPPGVAPPGGAPQEEPQIFHFPEWLRSGLTIVWTTMVSILIIVAIWRITSQIIGWMRKQAGTGGGQSESLGVSIWQDWLKWFKRLLARISRLWRRKDSRNAAITAEAASIRQIYAQWLRRMASLGYARQPGQTPLEYQSGLAKLLAPQQEAVSEITQEYMQVRYGAAVPSTPEIEKTRENWSVLKKADIKRQARKKTNKE